jgi:hypothetical protein
VQAQALRATIRAGAIVNGQLIELQQDCGNLWDPPGATSAQNAKVKPADEQIHAKVAAIMHAITQFATAHGCVVRKGIFVP